MAANMVIDQQTPRDDVQYGDGQPQLDKFRLRWELARLPALAPPAGEVRALGLGCYCPRLVRRCAPG